MRFVSYRTHKRCTSLNTYQNKFLPTTNSFWPNDYDLNEKNTTYLKFTQWLALYQADPDGWKTTQVSGDSCRYFVMPVYFRVNEKNLRIGDEPQFIKFLTWWDYCKWKKFLRKERVRGEDNENLKEYQMLLTSAQQVADKRVSEAQEQVRWQYDEMKRLIMSANKDFDLNKNKE
jgi:hypothetical protein